MNKNSEKLFVAAKQHILLAAHRGVCGGNIPCNTLASYQIALNQGADFIETDVAISKDGKLYTFHPRMEKPLLFCPRLLANMTSEEIAWQRYVNQDDVPTQFGVQTFDETLEFLKPYDCFINVDKFWTDIPQITEAIYRHNLQDRVLVKTPDKPEYLDLVEKYAPELPFMTVLQDIDNISDDLFKRNINCVGLEMNFSTEDCLLCSDEYIAKLHERGLLIWCNAIIYNYRKQLAAGHSDDISIVGREDEGWGWLIDKKFDIIQTDWLLPLRNYVQKRGLPVKEQRLK